MDIPEHLPTQSAASGLSPCQGRRNAPAGAEIAIMQGDTPSRREAALSPCLAKHPMVLSSGLMDRNSRIVAVMPRAVKSARWTLTRREAALPLEGPFSCD